MRNKTIFAAALALSVGATAIAPSIATAQTRAELERRQQQKNQWRNIGYASAAAAALGLMKDDKTLFWLGTAGALYSAHRYEQDRKSQSAMERRRAELYSRPYVIRDGVRYNRVSTTRNGQRYYYFAKAKGDNGRHLGQIKNANKGKGKKKGWRN